MKSVSRTVGESHVVEELVMSFTHTIAMDWFLPGVAPTGKPVEVAFCVVVGFKDGKISHEHIYWDQAGLLRQVDLLDPKGLPNLFGLPQETRSFRDRDAPFRHDRYIRQWRPGVQKKDANGAQDRTWLGAMAEQGARLSGRQVTPGYQASHQWQVTATRLPIWCAADDEAPDRRTCRTAPGGRHHRQPPGFVRRLRCRYGGVCSPEF
jgi:hypothetical protein